MSISQNFPEEGPTLNLNFAGSRTLDPRITFTRTSSATFMGRDGLVKIAPANSARFDHRYNSTTGEVESLGLLVEEARTNLITNSGDFSIWTKQTTSPGVVGITTTTATTSPDGTFNAYKYFIEESGGSFYAIFRGAPSISANVVYAYSVYVKSAELNRVVLSLADSSGGPNCTYDLTTGLPLTPFGSTNTTIHTVKMDSYSNGWYRCSMSFSNSIDNNVSQIKIGLPGPTFTQNNGIYIWGAQLEQGSFPTSYIPTTTSTVTRTADNVSMVGENFSSWYNQSEGTVYADTRIVGVQTVRFDRLWAITNSNLNQDGLGLFISGPSGTFGIYDITTTIGGVTQYPELAGTLGTSGMGITASSTPRLKSCFGFTTGNTNISYNGRLPNSSGVTITNLLTADRLFIGQPQRFQGHSCMTISQLTYYPRRLTNAQLVTLTR
jgi:hypothetical protein